jgi:hypothetical protein
MKVGLCHIGAPLDFEIVVVFFICFESMFGRACTIELFAFILKRITEHALKGGLL